MRLTVFVFVLDVSYTPAPKSIKLLEAGHDWHVKFWALAELGSLGHRLLVGASRKSFLGRLLADEAGEPRPVDDREAAHLAVVLHCARAGVWGVRVHDVGSTCDALSAWEALEEGGPRG